MVWQNDFLEACDYSVVFSSDQRFAGLITWFHPHLFSTKCVCDYGSFSDIRHCSPHHSVVT